MAARKEIRLELKILRSQEFIAVLRNTFLTPKLLQILVKVYIKHWISSRADIFKYYEVVQEKSRIKLFTVAE